VLEREVRANLVYRAFTRIGDEKVPDAMVRVNTRVPSPNKLLSVG
jgi:hypothetical protein